MTVVVDNLEKLDLVERRDNKEDRRSIIVQLTKRGHEKFTAIFPPHARHIESLASKLTHEEQVQLSALLKKLGLSLQEGNPL